MSTTMLEHALDYADHGWKVFPLAGKQPAIPNPHRWGTPERKTCRGECGLEGHGFRDATDDVATLSRWWHRWPEANIGAAVPDDVVVVDIDPRNGGSLAALPSLPETLTAWSGRGDGGCHLYFRLPRRVKALTSTRLPQGVDLKKPGGGYMVVPPSIHPDTGLPYRWTDAPVALLPAVLAELLTPPPPRASARLTPSTVTPGSEDEHPLVRFLDRFSDDGIQNALYWAACRADDDGILDALAATLAARATAYGCPGAEATVESARHRPARGAQRQSGGVR